MEMNNTIQRKLGSGLVWAALLPVLSTGLLSSVAFAQPDRVAGLPQDSVARASDATSQTLSIEGAKQLLEKTNAKADDLTYRPALWDWTSPATVKRDGEQLAQTPPTTSPTAQEVPAAEPQEQGDILDEVSVTATRRLTRARDTTATTYAIKKEDFQKQGAVTVTDALQLVPGFIGQPSLGGIRNAAGNFLRGFDDQRFQVLKDGLPLQRSSNNRTDIARFQTDDLERIEVVTGGATLRYGSGAVGGVINLITETPKGPPKLTLGYQVGSYGFSKYLAKYGGGDDTFSYNLIFSSQVAFNDYPFGFTLPNSAQFYGPNDVVTGSTDPNVPDGTSLYGFLKPELGPPLKVQGIADSAFNASDVYSGKLTFKPDPTNKLTFRVSQQNSRNAGNGPGSYGFGTCFGGGTLGVNETLVNVGTRFLPIAPNGSELSCETQRYIANTRTNLIALPYSFNTTSSGQPLPGPGQAYPAEQAIGTIDGFQVTSQGQTEVALQWDYEITPTASLNSFIYYFNFKGDADRAPFYSLGTNYLTQFGFPAVVPVATIFGAIGQPYFEGRKLVAETVLNWQFSAGGNLQFGANVTEDRTIQSRFNARDIFDPSIKVNNFSFFDQAITRSSAFLITDISFSDLVKTNLGLRYTYSTQFGAVLTPAAGLRITPTNWISLRGNWSYVFNAPSLSDLFVASGVFRPNPFLQPESGVTWDIGADFTPVQNVGIRATYFNTYLDGAIGTFVFPNPEGTAPRFLQQQRNLDSRYASGIEFTADWQATPEVSFRAVWTNSDVRQYGNVNSITGLLYLYGFQDPNIPFNNVVVAATYANKGLTATLLARYDSGKRRAGLEEFVPAWATLDFNVEIPVTPFFILTGNVFNLTDTQYEYVSGVPAPGTTFRVGGRFEIGG
ncbi:TonB-dependent receptor [Gloeobacter morelensis MG652769]|uniref:TonB-dependent receptor n=2 Tax=Gloeobacter TaxID=33071 RepID=A0ABY3PIE5_9CYAN|nr:TonB-dependent receptor [Gloeobacter morelensis MG652769]